MNLKSLINSIKVFFGNKKVVDRLNEQSIIDCRLHNKTLTILLHGVGANYYKTMYPAILFLRKNNIPIYSIGYDSGVDIRLSVKNIKKQIEDLIKKNNLKRVNILGICLGGFVARYYIELFGGKKYIDKLITVYSPYKQIHKKFPIFLNKLAGGNPENFNDLADNLKGKYSIKKHYAIYGKKDHIIGPQYPDKSIPKHVLQIPVKGGHLFVSFNNDAMVEALKYLKTDKKS